MKMGKVKRVLTLYVRFTDGQSINICNVAKEFSVNEKSVREIRLSYYLMMSCQNWI